MKVLVISVTEPGRVLARRLPYEHAHGRPGEVLAQRWRDVDAFVVILAVGATVRLLAPLTIPDTVLEEGLTILAASVKDACGLESTRAVA